MKEAQGPVNERLDHLEMRAMVCPEGSLADWLDGQKQGKRKPGGRWDGMGEHYVID